MTNYCKISVSVEEDVWLRFKNYVLQKYGCLYGYLGMELSRAMEEYLSHSPPAHTNKNVQQTLGKPNKRHLALLSHVVTFDEMTKSEIEKFIMKNFGSDRRTRNKYIQFLLKGRFIRVLKPLYGEVIYGVDKQKILNFLKEALSEEEFRSIAAAVQTEPKVENRSRDSIEAYVVERYHAGDSITEIKEKLETIGSFSDKKIKEIIRSAMREI